MRKLFLLGFLGISFGFLASSATAGNVAACDEERATNPDWPSGLYGLCVAYHNAAPGRAQDRIEQLYAEKARKAGYDDPVIPGAGTSCPCWNYEALAEYIEEEALAQNLCIVDTDSEDAKGFDFVNFGSIQIFAGYTPIKPDELHECLIIGAPQNLDLVREVYVPTKELEDLQCRLDVLDLIIDPGECFP